MNNEKLDPQHPDFQKIMGRRVPVKLKQFSRLLGELTETDIDPVRVKAMESQIRRTRETCLEHGVEPTAKLLNRILSQLSLDDETLNSQKPLMRRFVSRLEFHADKLQQGDLESLTPTAKPPMTVAAELPSDTSPALPSESEIESSPSDRLDDLITIDSVEEQEEEIPLISDDLDADQIAALENLSEPNESATDDTINQSNELAQDSEAQTIEAQTIEAQTIEAQDIEAEDIVPSDNFDPGFDEADFPAPPERAPHVEPEPAIDAAALAAELDLTAAELTVDDLLDEDSVSDESSADDPTVNLTDHDDLDGLAPNIDTSAYVFESSAAEPTSIRGNELLQSGSELNIHWCVAGDAYDEVKQQLFSFGYSVEDSDIDSAIELASGHSQKVVIAALDAFEDNPDQPINSTAQLVLLAEHDNLENRLKGIRLGSTLFFAEPVDTVNLMEYLDTLEAPPDSSAYRVLVMEDSKAQAKFNDKVLSSAGFDTRIVIEPMELLNSLATFDPEVIFMDMQMPDCNGIELTRVLRQIERFTTIPIVFLSAEENAEKQQQALTSGGNAFLSKPIQKDHLLFMAELYSRRTRRLQPHLSHDIQTGLDSVSKMHEQLAIEAERAMRQNSAMFLALIEIDTLDQLNSRLGYVFGDRAKQQLTRLLRQRLRKTDCVGYFDSHRIGIILSNCSDSDAESVLSYLQQTFAATPVAFERQEVAVTLSVGIAKLGNDFNVPKLIKRAEAAINQVLSDPETSLIWAHDKAN